MDLDACLHSISQLEHEKLAWQSQTELLKNFVDMAHSSTQGDMLKATIQNTLNIVVRLSAAKDSSIFIFDSEGNVSAKILARGEVQEREQLRAVRQVLNKGLAGWVLENRQIGRVDDTRTDSRWLSLPDETYSVRSALVVPIMRGPMTYGIITLMHPDAGHFNSETIDVIRMTADQIALVLENVELYEKLEASNRSLEQAKQSAEAYSTALDRELEKGHQIQKDFLPQSLPALPDWELVTRFHPAYHVAGDFYDVFALPGDLVALVLGDVCDKGVGAALFMALFRSLVRIFSGQPGLCKLVPWDANAVAGASRDAQSGLCDDQINALQAVELTNAYILNNHSEMGIFSTLFFGILDVGKGRLGYINAGHEPPYILNASGIKQTLTVTGPSVGIMPDSRFEIEALQLDAGDVLLAFSDGLIDAGATDGQMFGKKRLVEMLQAGTQSAARLVERIENAVSNFSRGADPTDDMTILALGCKNHR